VNLRKIIRETLETAINKQVIADKFDQDITYLSGFKLINKKEGDRADVWALEHKAKNYIFRFFIEKDKKIKTWTAKVFVYWKKISKEFTSAKGKEYEHSFGPFDSYELMVQTLNEKLKNNPNLAIENFVDDNRSQFDKDLIYMFKLLKKNIGLLQKVKDPHFDELKEIYEKIKGLNSDEELKEFISQEAYDVEEKQSLLLVLENIYKLVFFIKKEKLESIF